uniref:Uncharacterized protein n=1 Tax=Talaromyces marneffei PM1 TaxID=1077442 RepID=A0A093W2K6_TALMA
MQTIQEQQEQACRRVSCQRIFPRKTGSQYFAIIDEEEDSDPIPTTPGSTIWEQASRQYAEYEKQAAERIQQGYVDEANPWLRRTGWVPYFTHFRTQLLEYIDMPAMDDAVNHSPVADLDEQAIQAIWTAMGQVGQISQQSVIHTGVFVRMEAIRTERHQTRYQPLEAYQDPETMTERVRPWQQMLMFFWRTQHRTSDERHPPYRFTQRQHAAWNRLVQIARPRIPPPSPGRSLVLQPGQRRPWELSLSPGSSESSRSEDESFTDDDEMDEDMNRDSEPDPELDPVSESSIPPLTPIQRACLDFCIELLNQRVVHREYDCALVCAMAVLGVRDRGGWRTPEDYPPILSKVIKLARFMVVRKAIELAENEDDAEPASSMQENDWDSAYGGSPSPRATPSKKGCLQWVTQMMDRFMVRGSQSPMQWMLDLRTYGLKIHYNTTTEGHVTWQNIPWHGRPHGRCTADLDGGFAAMPPSGPDSWDQLYDNPFNEDPNGVCAGSADPMALDGTAGYGSISRIIPHYPSLIQATATAFSPSAGRHSTDGSHVFGEAAGGGPIHMANPLVPRVVEHST